MSSPIETFKISGKDRETGEPVEHTYVVAKHGGTDGIAVIDKMLELGAGPIISALFGAMSLSESGGVKEDLRGALGKIDPSAMASALQQGLRASGGLKVLAPMLLKHTRRNGVLLTAAEIDIAYAANYGELIKALSKVFEINGFFDVLAIFSTDES